MQWNLYSFCMNRSLTFWESTRGATSLHEDYSWTGNQQKRPSAKAKFKNSCVYTPRASTQFVAVCFFSLPENFNTQKYVLFACGSPAVANGNLWFTADLFPFVLNGLPALGSKFHFKGRAKERMRERWGFPMAAVSPAAGLRLSNTVVWAQLRARKMLAFVTPQSRVCICSERFIAIANGAKRPEWVILLYRQKL